MLSRLFDLIDWYVKAAWDLFADLIHSNYDKTLLTMMFIFMVMILLHMSHDSMDQADISWARENASLIVGGLLGLIKGDIKAKWSTNGNGNGGTTSATDDKGPAA